MLCPTVHCCCQLEVLCIQYTVLSMELFYLFIEQKCPLVSNRKSLSSDATVAVTVCTVWAEDVDAKRLN